jgi:hypothetical protein
MPPPGSVSAGASTTGGWRRPDGRWHGPGAAVGHAVNITSRSQTPATAWSTTQGSTAAGPALASPGSAARSWRPRSRTVVSRSTLTTKPSPSTSCTSSSRTTSSAATQVAVFITANSSSPATSKAGRLAAVPSLSASARQLLSAGVAQAHQTKLWPGAAPGPVPRPLW